MWQSAKKFLFLYNESKDSFADICETQKKPQDEIRNHFFGMSAILL